MVVHVALTSQAWRILFSSLCHLSLLVTQLTHPGMVGGIQSMQLRVYDTRNFSEIKDRRRKAGSWKK